MPVTYTKSGGEGHVYQVPDYAEAADGPKGFKDFADFLDLILPPVGSIMPYVGATAPTGWLVCDGSSYSSTSYPKLSALCGTKFGTAGTGLFKVPDLRGKMVAGLDSSQTEFATIGKTGGAKSVTLTTSQLPSHDHTVPDHNHTIAGGGTVTTSSSGSHGHTLTLNTVNTNLAGSHSHGGVVTGTTSATGDSGNGARLKTATTGTTGTQISHQHSVTPTGNIADAAGHDHTVTISGLSASGGNTTTATAGSGASVTTISPYLTLNHIIRAA